MTMTRLLPSRFIMLLLFLLACTIMCISLSIIYLPSQKKILQGLSHSYATATSTTGTNTSSLNTNTTSPLSSSSKT
jgi:uncharacterized membrane protein